MHITPCSEPPLPWQVQLRQVVTDYDDLLQLLRLPECPDPNLEKVMKQFPLRVPIAYLSRIRLGDWNDPLLKQVLPLGIESVLVPGYHSDPLREQDYNPVKGLIHKYHSRVLLTLTGSCAIHCRYCFRRHFDYQSNQVSQSGWQSAIDYIAKQPSITEVIFSGGDPLVVPDRMLNNLVDRLSDIPHLRYLRIHTRLPIVIPSRVDEHLACWLGSTRLKTSLVLHCNHPQELDVAVADALKRLASIGVTLFNQTVLLRGINADVETLEALSYRLYDLGVLPYYLHVLDKVQGAAHFDVVRAEACDIYEGLLAALPGYLVPKLVCEIPGVPFKSPIYCVNSS